MCAASPITSNSTPPESRPAAVGSLDILSLVAALKPRVRLESFPAGFNNFVTTCVAKRGAADMRALWRILENLAIENRHTPEATKQGSVDNPDLVQARKNIASAARALVTTSAEIGFKDMEGMLLSISLATGHAPAKSCREILQLPLEHTHFFNGFARALSCDNQWAVHMAKVVLPDVRDTFAKLGIRLLQEKIPNVAIVREITLALVDMDEKGIPLEERRTECAKLESQLLQSDDFRLHPTVDMHVLLLALQMRKGEFTLRAASVQQVATELIKVCDPERGGSPSSREIELAEILVKSAFFANPSGVTFLPPILTGAVAILSPTTMLSRICAVYQNKIGVTEGSWHNVYRVTLGVIERIHGPGNGVEVSAISPLRPHQKHTTRFEAFSLIIALRNQLSMPLLPWVLPTVQHDLMVILASSGTGPIPKQAHEMHGAGQIVKTALHSRRAAEQLTDILEPAARLLGVAGRENQLLVGGLHVFNQGHHDPVLCAAYIRIVNSFRAAAESQKDADESPPAKQKIRSPLIYARALVFTLWNGDALDPDHCAELSELFAAWLVRPEQSKSEEMAQAAKILLEAVCAAPQAWTMLASIEEQSAVCARAADLLLRCGEYKTVADLSRLSKLHSGERYSPAYEAVLAGIMHPLLGEGVTLSLQHFDSRLGLVLNHRGITRAECEEYHAQIIAQLRRYDPSKSDDLESLVLHLHQSHLMSDEIISTLESIYFGSMPMSQ